MEQILILGTGLIGASVGLALKAAGCPARITGFDPSGLELEISLERGAIDARVNSRDAALDVAREADVVLIATPVMAVLDWMRLLAPVMGEHQLVTDVGSTKAMICIAATELFNQPERAAFLPGHPMAGKEMGGAAIADATLFQNAMWLFTPQAGDPVTPLVTEWRALVLQMGARTRDLDPQHHDELCAWVSHLPQMLSTALASLLEERFGSNETARSEIAAIGGRALRETTRLGASPFSMWRDIALTNTEPLADTLLALEQALAHLRENLRTPELRELFLEANRFRSR